MIPFRVRLQCIGIGTVGGFGSYMAVDGAHPAGALLICIAAAIVATLIADGPA